MRALTKRDEHLLRSLARFRAIRGQDLHRYLFRGRRRDTMSHRAASLAKRGYLWTFPRQSPADEHVYALGSTGRAWCRAHGVQPGRRPQLASLAHDLSVVSTWVHLAIACQERTDRRLISAVPDWEARSARTVPLIPDLVAKVRCCNAVRTLAVEIDRGTEPLRTIARKVRRYRELVAHPAGSGELHPVLVFVLADVGQRRARSIRGLLEAWPGRSFVLVDGALVEQLLATLGPPQATTPNGLGCPEVLTVCDKARCP